MNVVLDVFHRRRRVKYHADLFTQRTDLVNDTERVAIDGFGVRANKISTGFGYRFDKVGRIFHHHMHVQNQRRMRADLFDKERRQRDVFDVMAVHDVDVQHVSAAVQHFELLFDVDQAHAHQRRRNFVFHDVFLSQRQF